jgi:hypothetical protein
MSIRRVTLILRRSLESLLGTKRELFHWSDRLRTTEAENLVGIAAWLGEGSLATAQESVADLRRRLQKHSKMLVGCHVVYVGESFWERLSGIPNLDD